MRILVTGGSGFIGTRLVEILVGAGHEVKIFDKAPSRRFPDLMHLGDVRDLSALTAAVRGNDLVYHLAAEHKDDVRPPTLYAEVNVGGATNLAAACEQGGVSKIVFTSTVAVYGLGVKAPTEDSPPNPFNEYGRSKLMAEKILGAWAAAQRPRSLVIVRPTVVFGEGNRGNVFNLARQIAMGGFLMVGNGRNRKSMAYVENVSSFLATLADAEEKGTITLNYSDKPDLTMRELVGAVRASLGLSERYLAIPYWLGVAGGACLDLLSAATGRVFPISVIRIRKFCSETTVSSERVSESGFTPPYTLSEGLSRFLRHEFDPGQGNV